MVLCGVVEPSGTYSKSSGSLLPSLSLIPRSTASQKNSTRGRRLFIYAGDINPQRVRRGSSWPREDVYDTATLSSSSTLSTSRRVLTSLVLFRAPRLYFRCVSDDGAGGCGGAVFSAVWSSSRHTLHSAV